MSQVCEILEDFSNRIADIERKLAQIGIHSTIPEGFGIAGSTWEVSGSQIALWTTDTERPLSWTQGQWARLRAGKVEARGSAFDFRSSDSGARVLISGSGLELYSSSERTVYLDASTGDAEFKGTIHAGAGEIAGWDISTDKLSKNNAELRSAGALVLGTGDDIVVITAVDATYRLYAGSATPASAPFSVTKAGALQSISGVIGGWTITSTELHNTDIWLDAEAKQLAIKSQTFGAAGIQLEYNAGSPRFYVGDGANAFLNFDGTKLSWKAANTELDTSGNLTAANATITGTIHADAGDIAGWTINSDNLAKNGAVLHSSGYLVLGSGAAVVRLDAQDATYRLWVGAAAGADAPFSVTKTGAIKATSGNIGGWGITSSVLQKFSAGSVGIILDSTTPSIKVGDTSATYILIDGASEEIGVSNFLSGTRGWRIDANGNAEFNNIVARGIIRTPIFLKDEVSAIGGSFLVAATDALVSDCTTASALEGSFTFECARDYFSVNDVVRCKPDASREFWAIITNVSGIDPYVYTATLKSGSTSTIFHKGEAIVSYGANGQGLVLLTATETNSPYVSIFTHAGSPWSTITERARIGKLDGITDAKFGALSGYGLWTDQGYFTGKLKATDGELQTLDITGYLLLTGSGTIWTSSGLPSLRLDASGLKAYNAAGSIVSQLESATGKLWAKLGGFGGNTSANPKIVLNSDGSITLNDLTVVGTLELLSDGKIVTATTGPRIELTSSLFAGYSDAATKEFYVDATTGKAYFAGGNAVMDKTGIALSDQLDIIYTPTITSGTKIGVSTIVTGNPSAAGGNPGIYGGYFAGESDADNTFSLGTLLGAVGTSGHYGTGNINDLYGLYASVFLRAGCGDTTNMYGVSSSVVLENTSGDVLGSAFVFQGIWAVGDTAGTIAHAYGIWIPDVSKHSTNHYGVWQDGENDVNVFKGKVGIGTTEPNYPLQVITGNNEIIAAQMSGATNIAGLGILDTSGNMLGWFVSDYSENNVLFENKKGGNFAVGIAGTGSREFQMIANDYTSFDVAGSRVMTLQDNGNVGIGTTEPSEKLEVDGNVKLTDDDEYFEGLTKPKYHHVSANPSQQLSSAWTWVNLTGCSVTFTTYTTEDWLIVGRCHMNKNGANAGDVWYIGLTKDGGTSTQEAFRAAFESDDWPIRGWSYYYSNVASGTYTIQLRGKVANTVTYFYTQDFVVLRFKH